MEFTYIKLTSLYVLTNDTYAALAEALGWWRVPAEPAMTHAVCPQSQDCVEPTSPAITSTVTRGCARGSSMEAVEEMTTGSGRPGSAIDDVMRQVSRWKCWSLFRERVTKIDIVGIV